MEGSEPFLNDTYCVFKIGLLWPSVEDNFSPKPGSALGVRDQGSFREMGWTPISFLSEYGCRFRIEGALLAGGGVLFLPGGGPSGSEPLRLGFVNSAPSPTWVSGEFQVWSQVIKEILFFPPKFFFFFLLLNDFYLFHYSWLTVFCHFSTVQQRDPVTHTHICIYILFLTLSSIVLHHK